MSLTLSKVCCAVSPSPTLSIDARAKEMKAQGVDVVGFGAGEPDFDTPEYIRDAAKYALDHGYTRYTPAAGMMELRKAICKKLLRDNGLRYEPAQVIVGNGAKHSLFSTFTALLNPGDEVIIPAPYWVSYPELVRMAGGVPVFVPTREADGFLPDPGALEAMVTLRTKAIVVNSPTWPPLSPPSAISADAPRRSMRLAIATEATTGMTLMPASFHIAMYLPGLPAPVVTTATFSSAATCATSSA